MKEGVIKRPFQPSRSLQRVGTNSSFVATEEHDSNNGEHNELIHLSGDKYVLFYKGASSDGFAKVFKITANGETIEQLSSALEFATSDWEGSAVKMTDSTLVCPYGIKVTMGYIKNLKVASDGSTIHKFKKKSTIQAMVNGIPWFAQMRIPTF